MTFPGTKLPLRVLLDLVGDGSFTTDITSDVRTRDTVVINRGRPDESSTFETSTCQLTLNNRSGNYSSRNPTGIYYGRIGRNTPMMVGIDLPSTYLAVNVFTGSTTPGAGANVSTPDTAALDITGDYDLRFDADMDTWWTDCELLS